MRDTHGMPHRSDIPAELSQSAAQGSPPDFDRIRRRYLAGLHRRTERDVNHAGRAFIEHHLVAPSAQAVQIALGLNPPAG